MSFGWSIGDIALAITTIYDIVKALDPKDGASSSFRETKSFLEDLTRTLQQLEKLATNGRTSAYEHELHTYVDKIRGPVTNFLDEIQKFEPGLGKAARDGFLRSTKRKMQWHYFIEPKAKALQEQIRNNLQLLDQQIQGITRNMIDEIPERMRSVFTESLVEVLDSRLSQLSDESYLQPDMLRPLESQLIAQKDAAAQGYDSLIFNLQNYKSQTTGALDICLEMVQAVKESSRARSEGSRSPMPQQKLDSHHEKSAVKELISEADQFEASAPLVEDLVDWLGEPHTALLWLQGPIDGNFTALITACILATARTAGIPTVSFFCEQEQEDDRTDLSGLEMLTRLTSSFVFQLNDLYGNSRLVYPLASLSQALTTIEELLSSRKEQGLIILIDAFHLLDDTNLPESKVLAQRLFSILKKTSLLNANTKIFLSTSGLRSVLLDLVPGDCRRDEIDHTEYNNQALIPALMEVSVTYLGGVERQRF